MAVFLCFILGLLLWTRAGGSEVKQLFVQTGSDVTLDIMDPDALQNHYVLRWNFNNSKFLVTAPRNGQDRIYTERVVYHPQNFSLTLKNLQEEHSGLYQAEVIKHTPATISYSITVQAPVSEVSLRVDSVSLSSESCNVTVSCTTESSSISRSFSCDRHTCEEPRPLTPDPAPSLHLYLSNVSVICNHSNYVSWKNDAKEIHELCPIFGDKDPPVCAPGSGCELKTAVFSVGLLLMVSALISVHVLECIRKKNI